MLSTSWVPPPYGLGSMRCTGVAKSVTLIDFCRFSGRRTLPTSITTLLPWVRRSGLAPLPSNCRINRPAPSSPRLKSILDTASDAGAVAGAAAAGMGAAAGVAASSVPLATMSATPSAHRWISFGRRSGRCSMALEKVIVLSP
ncbi:hypothetical protein D3C71_1550050 [compost metagenome]